MKISGIYKISNNINNKIYIGSSVNIIKRWQDHIRQLNKKIHINKHLQNAWIKYGESSFNFSIIESTTCNLMDLRRKESNLISLLNSSNRSIGYNIIKQPTIGGINSKKVAQYDNNGILLHCWESATLAAKNVGLTSPCRILNSCKKGGRAGGYYWTYIVDIASPTIKIVNTGRTILKKLGLSIYVFKDNSLIDCLLTQKDLCIKYKISLSQISQILKNRKNMHLDYYIVFAKTEDEAILMLNNKIIEETNKKINRSKSAASVAYNNIQKNKKAVISIDKDGKIEKFNSLVEAAAYNNVTDGAICQALTNRYNNRSAGKTWKYVDK